MLMSSNELLKAILIVVYMLPCDANNNIKIINTDQRQTIAKHKFYLNGQFPWCTAKIGDII